MKPVRSFTLLLLLLFFSISSIVFAQQTGTVKGVVTNESNGKPLAGVNVIVQNTNKGATTNVNGSFTISGIKSGSQALVFSFIGFEKVSREVTVVAGQTLKMSVQLLPDAVLMEGIKVTALRPDQIAEARLQKTDVQQANPRDSGELLRSVEGVDAVRRGPVGLDPVIRGLRETEVGTISTVPVSSPADPLAWILPSVTLIPPQLKPSKW